MPVNFSTPDPGIIERPYVQQVPLEALFKNMGYKQAKYDQGVQQAKQQVDMLNNIASYGQDTEIKHEMFRKLNQELEKFSGANYGDAAVSAQLEGLINNFTMTKDIAGMQSRAYALDKMEKEEEAARLKGQEYYNPGLNQARKYYQSGAYKKDVRFSDEGNIAPDFAALTKNILDQKNVSYEKQTMGPDGRLYKQQVVDANAAAAEWKLRAENDPKLAKYLKYKFEESNEGTDWQQAGVQHYQTKAELAARTAAEYARYIQLERAKANPDEATIASYTAQLGYQQSLVDGYLNVARDPKLVGEDYRRILYGEYLQDEANRFGKSKELLTTTDISTDSYILQNLTAKNNLNNSILMEQYRAITEGALALGYTPQEALADSTKRKEAMEKMAELEYTKAYKKEEAKNIFRSQGSKLLDSNVGATDIVYIAGIPLQKQEWNRILGVGTKARINENDKKYLVEIIKAHPDRFTKLSSDDITKLKESDLEINANGDIEFDNSYAPWGETPILTSADFQAAVNTSALDRSAIGADGATGATGVDSSNPLLQ